MTLVRLAGREQSLGEHLGTHRGRAFPHPDHHRAVSDHVDVATFDRRRQVVQVVVAVVGHELRVGEERVEAVDGPAVQRLALAGRLGHRVDGHAAVDPAGVVSLEEVVRQRREEEVVGPQRLPLEAAPGADRVHVALEDPADEVRGERLAVEVLEEAAQWTDERSARGSRACTVGRARRRDPRRSRGPPPSSSREVVHVDALVPQGLGEGVVFLLGLLGPHHVVEEQLADVLRREPGQLQTRPVDDGLAELAHLRVDTKRHSGSSCRVFVSVVACRAQADLGSSMPARP